MGIRLADERVVVDDLVTIEVPFQVVKVRKCDGANDHYYWRVTGGMEADDSECWPSIELAQQDAEDSLLNRAKS